MWLEWNYTQKVSIPRNLNLSTFAPSPEIREFPWLRQALGLMGAAVTGGVQRFFGNLTRQHPPGGAEGPEHGPAVTGLRMAFPEYAPGDILHDPPFCRKPEGFPYTVHIAGDAETV